MSNKIKGKYGEDLAVNFLIKQGYKILERNYHFSRYGEIDIIAEFKGIITFIEVKTRTQDKFGTPLEAITKTKLEKIIKSAFSYLQNPSFQGKKFQIDAISILLESDEKTVKKIEHIKNIEL